MVFATLLTPNPCFWSPRRPDSDPKIVSKSDLETSMEKTQKFVKGFRKAFKMRSQNPPKINKNQSLDPKTSFLVLPGAPGSSRVHPGAKVEAPACQISEMCATRHGPPTRDNTTRHGPARFNTDCDDPTRTAMIQHASFQHGTDRRDPTRTATVQHGPR